MNRQLYMGGGIMNARPRQQYGLGSFVKKAVKKVTGGVKDIVSSDLGKAALAGAAVYGLGGGTFGGLRASAPGFSFANLPGAGFFGSGSINPLKTLVSSEGFSGLGPSKFAQFLGTNTGKFAAGSVLASLFAGMSAADQADIDEVDPDERGDVVAEKLRQSLTRLGYTGQVLEDKVAEGVSEYTGYTSKAEGGRIGFDMGSPREGIGSLAGPGDLLAAPTDLELSSDGIVMEGKSKPLDFNFNDIVEELKEKKNKPVLFTDGITYYPEYNTFLDSDANEVSGPSEGAEPIEENLRKSYDATKRDKIDRLFPVEAAKGGRIGYAVGSDGPVLPEDPTKPVNPFAPKPTGPVLPNKAEVTAEQLAMDLFGKTIERLTGEQREMLIMMLARSQAQDGGIMNRINYALGGEDTASQNAMQAAGIEGLPMRQNPKGVQELDLRDNGGFIPPVGIKEKEDDIPAMLSNNEFVFTADAVRGMGDGDVELGAQRMYDQMKKLEEGGRV